MVLINFTLFLKESWTQESWPTLWMPTVYTWNKPKFKFVYVKISGVYAFALTYLFAFTLCLPKNITWKKNHLGLLLLIFSTNNLSLNGDLLQKEFLKVFAQNIFLFSPLWFCFLIWKKNSEVTSSKHLKGQLGPRVGNVTFLHQRRSVGSPCQ